MAVRAKFKCKAVENGNISLEPVYGESEENKAATPGGSIMLNVVNPAAVAQFEPGKEYYVDFTPAP